MSGGLDWGWFVATVVAGALLSLWTHHCVGPWLVPQARERGSIPAEGQKGQNRRRPRGRVSGCTANHKSCHVWCWAFKPESLVLILQEKLNLAICVHLCEHMWATSCSGRHALACKSSSMCRWKYCKETDWAKFILTQEENGFQAAERGWVTHTHGGAGWAGKSASQVDAWTGGAQDRPPRVLRIFTSRGGFTAFDHGVLERREKNAPEWKQIQMLWRFTS